MKRLRQRLVEAPRKASVQVLVLTILYTYILALLPEELRTALKAILLP
jgi:hypothetical protein